MDLILARFNTIYFAALFLLIDAPGNDLHCMETKYLRIQPAPKFLTTAFQEFGFSQNFN
jgi:hypothetical protein